MQRKRIVLCSLMSLILLASLVVFGVYASLSSSLTLNHTIGFRTSNNVFIGVDCNISGCLQSEASVVPGGYNSLQDYYEDIGLVYSYEFDESMRGDDIQTLPSWKIGGDNGESMKFLDKDTPIVYNITIYNYSLKDINIVADFGDTEYFTNTATVESENGTENYNKNSGFNMIKYKIGEKPKVVTLKISTLLIDHLSFPNKSVDNNFKLTFKTI